MTAPRKLRPAAAAPASIEDQHAQAVSAERHAAAALADAEHALDAAFAAFVAGPSAESVAAYSAARAHRAGVTELAREAKAWTAEVREALQRHRAWEADAPKRAAQSAEAEAEARIWRHPANAERLLAEALAADATGNAFGSIPVRAQITDALLDAGLSRFVRRGNGTPEPRFVALDHEAFAEFLRRHVRVFRQHPDLVASEIRRLTGYGTPEASDRIAVSTAAAMAPVYSSPSLGGFRR